MVSLADHARWIGSFFRHGTRVASLAPTGRRLAREMCREIDSDTPQRILELGTGMGTVTRTALELKHPESELVSIELDAKLLEVAKRTAPGTTLSMAALVISPNFWTNTGGVSLMSASHACRFPVCPRA